MTYAEISGGGGKESEELYPVRSPTYSFLPPSLFSVVFRISPPDAETTSFLVLWFYSGLLLSLLPPLPRPPSTLVPRAIGRVDADEVRVGVESEYRVVEAGQEGRW